jgi:hypothetical protein
MTRVDTLTPVASALHTTYPQVVAVFDDEGNEYAAKVFEEGDDEEEEEEEEEDSDDEYVSPAPNRVLLFHAQSFIVQVTIV